MFKFEIGPHTNQRRPSMIWSDSPDPYRLPTGLITAALVVAAMIAMVLIDESCQFDPIQERDRLEQKLVVLRGTAKELAERREQLVALDREADIDPGVIHKKSLPPRWKLPLSCDTVEQWHKTAARRLKRTDEELARATSELEQTAREITELPPPEAKRVSIFRRILRFVLGDFELPPDD